MTNKIMKSVVAAYIEVNDKFLIAQRADGKFKGKWEFPGGKNEPGECDEVAIQREIKEELNLDIKAHELMGSTYEDIPADSREDKKTIILKLYNCELLGGDLQLRAHSDYRFISKDEINNYELCTADYKLLNSVPDKSVKRVRRPQEKDSN